jgi:hypothetical protein
VIYPARVYLYLFVAGLIVVFGVEFLTPNGLFAGYFRHAEQPNRAGYPSGRNELPSSYRGGGAGRAGGGPDPWHLMARIIEVTAAFLAIVAFFLHFVFHVDVS